MRKRQKKGPGRPGDAREATAPSRGVKTETVVILVAAAFLLGVIVGAVVALLKTPYPHEARQTGTPIATGEGSVGETDLSQQIQIAQKLVGKDPENPDPWVHLGDLYYRGKQYEEAIEAYGEALQLTPASTDVRIRLGNAYFDNEAYEKAIETYTKTLREDPNNADVMTDLGIAYRRTHKPKKAVETFRKAARIDPSHRASRYNLGVVLLHDLNDTQGAIEAWEGFLRAEPEGQRAEQVKGMIETLRSRSSTD
ncbi:MAG: tetratricopeptide repeat protein [Proteobacteria bacterium]|nr:tetratricopeptide repeat protein [Pseudomonadota bacterium]NIS69676.1 tetratricopeptide repeat protein [Pseudomonadota bacterium]